MNAVELEEAVSQLAAEPFRRAAFPFAFLAASSNKPAAIARLRSGASNASDVLGGPLQPNKIHISTCKVGMTPGFMEALNALPPTLRLAAKQTCEFNQISESMRFR